MTWLYNTMRAALGGVLLELTVLLLYKQGASLIVVF